MNDIGMIVQEYAHNPINNYEIKEPDAYYQEWNPLCWDWINVFLKIDEKWYIKEFSFSWDTSMVTTAAVSLFAEEISWYHIDDVLSLDYNFMKELWFEVSERRKRSAVLWLLATRNAIHQYKNDWQTDDFDDLIDD